MFHSNLIIDIAHLPYFCFPFQSWARKEAVARNKLQSEGVELKYGHFYSDGNDIEFQKEIGESPTIQSLNRK